MSARRPDLRVAALLGALLAVLAAGPAGAAPPPNDEEGTAQLLTVGNTFYQANTAEATERPGENLACPAAATEMGRTVWFRFDALRGSVAIEAAGYDNVVALYRAGDTAQLACAAGGSGGSFLGYLIKEPGEYRIQVGGRGAGAAAATGTAFVRVHYPVGPDADGDGFTAAQGDCEDGNKDIRPGAFDNPDNTLDEDCKDGPDTKDRDGDGVSRPTDCDDNDRNAHPALGTIPAGVEVRGNRVDEDCDGTALPFAQLESDVKRVLRPREGYGTFERLTVTKVPAGATVTATCRGRRCPRRTFRRTLTRPGNVSLLGFVGRRRLVFGVVVQVRISAPETIGKQFTFTVAEDAVRVERCLPPGGGAPYSC